MMLELKLLSLRVVERMLEFRGSKLGGTRIGYMECN